MLAARRMTKDIIMREKREPESFTRWSDLSLDHGCDDHSQNFLGPDLNAS